MIPIGAQITGRLCTRRLRSLDFLGMRQDRRLLEELIAAAVIRVEMRIDDDIDIVRLDADTRKAWQKGILRAHDRRHALHQRSPSFFAMLDDGGMTPGVEQHIALLVPDQRADYGRLERLASIGALDIDALFQAEPAGG